MEWLTAPFEFGFQQRALIGGSLAATALSVVGTWVVIRGMSFLGDALIHGVVPGIALATLLDFSVVAGAVIAAVVMLAGISLIHRQTTFSEDTGIGLLFVGMLALGVILISRTPSFAGNLTEILFGDALGVDAGDIVLQGIVALVAVLASALLYRPLLVLSFNEQKADLLGLRPGPTHVVLLAMITVAVVGSFQTVGTLLVFGLLIAPPATAALLAKRVPTIMILGAAIGVLSVAAGLIISYHADTSGSATIAFVPVVLFFLVLAWKSIREARRQPASA